MKHIKTLVSFLILISVVHCKGPEKQPDDEQDTTKKVKAVLPNNFNADSAYVYIEKQVSRGEAGARRQLDD